MQFVTVTVAVAGEHWPYSQEILKQTHSPSKASVTTTVDVKIFNRTGGPKTLLLSLDLDQHSNVDFAPNQFMSEVSLKAPDGSVQRRAVIWAPGDKQKDVELGTLAPGVAYVVRLTRVLSREATQGRESGRSEEVIGFRFSLH